MTCNNTKYTYGLVCKLYVMKQIVIALFAVLGIAMYGTDEAFAQVDGSAVDFSNGLVGASLLQTFQLGTIIIWIFVPLVAIMLAVSAFLFIQRAWQSSGQNAARTSENLFNYRGDRKDTSTHS